MRTSEDRAWRFPTLVVLAIGLVIGVAGPVQAESFRESLARVDAALQRNPNHVSNRALTACQNRRRHAASLFASGYEARAKRGLRSCFQLLGIPAEGPAPEASTATAEAIAKRQAAELAKRRKQAAREYERALGLEPDLERGLEIYRSCAACHLPEGWGLAGGSVPQIAGQHRKVVIKQLADIRAGSRENQLMAPYASVERIGGAQAIADVAGYIDSLEITIENGKGSGKDLEHGQQLYAANCARCHGPQGEGDDTKRIPRIQAQHYGYLTYQFEQIRDGKRRNADPEMVEQIEQFEQRDIEAVMDYVSRLQPPEALQAPEGWRNPDFLEVAEAR